MYVLGISCYFHDAAAALFKDGTLVAAAEEERFSRKKHDYEFPINAIDFCLAQAGIEGGDLEQIVFFEKPFVKFDRLIKTSLAGFPRTYNLFVSSMRTWLFDKLWIKSLIAKHLRIDTKKIVFSEHHLSHAASAFFCSPFDEAAVLTFDGVGEWATTTMGVGRGNELKITHELYFPHSIGLLYSAFTAFLGFEVNEGEYKVMGMAPFGEPRYVDEVWKVVHQDDDGAYRLDNSYFSFHYSTKTSYTRKFLSLFGEPRDPEVPFVTATSGYPSYFGELPDDLESLYTYNQRYADLAASLQAVTEELILNLARAAHRETGLTQLCLAGGVALNSVANGRILRETPFEELYVQPSAGDGGGSLGAALIGWHHATGRSERFVMQHAFWGKEYDNSEVGAALREADVQGRLIEDEQELLDATAERIADGQVIGWFQGRFEWGPRALGNRSIIADPRRDDMKDTVNTKIKFREPFRPFAPSVLGNAAERYFELPGAETSMPARFMLLVVPVKEDMKEVVPAVNHLGTARLQTVHKDVNGRYYGLIKTLGEATGHPLVLNTSFNVRGEPIVESPADALRTFANSGLDALVMQNYLVEKNPNGGV